MVTWFFVIAYMITCGMAAWNPITALWVMLGIGCAYFIIRRILMSIFGIVLGILAAGFTLGILPIIMLFVKIVAINAMFQRLGRRIPLLLGTCILYGFFAGASWANSLPFIITEETIAPNIIWIVGGVYALLGFLLIEIVLFAFHSFSYRKSSIALYALGFPGYAISVFISLLNMMDFDELDTDADSDFEIDFDHHDHRY